MAYAVALPMAQVSRAMRRLLLRALPRGARDALLACWPNLRKAAPEGMRFAFPLYYGDIRVNIDTHYKVERIMWSGLYEPPLVRFLERQPTDGWVCFDAGANVGAVSLVLAKLCGPAGKVYAFEPGPPNLERLRANVALNPSLEARLEIIPAGVGSAAGELGWSEEPGNPGNALLSAEGSLRVPVITLDDFAASHSIARLDFIKIDVEGMELDVMRGAQHTLRRFHPALYFETLPRYVRGKPGAGFAAMEEFLSAAGYDLYALRPSGELRPLAGRPGGYTVALPRPR